MASIYKPVGKSKYIIEYTDENGDRRKKVGATDKVVTEQFAREIESRVFALRNGMIDPKAKSCRDHESRSLAYHIAEWQADLIAKGHTVKHADQSADRVRRLIAIMFGATPDKIDGKRLGPLQQADLRREIARLVGKARLSSLAVEQVQAALATIRQSGRSAQTCNHYRACIRALGRWAWKTGRLGEDPLVGLTGFNAREDRRHDRRTISLDELHRLILAAEQGPKYNRMTGPARALCYRLAASTGLRYSEISSIVPESFDWESSSVRVEAAYTKNGEVAELPLPGDLVDDLKVYMTTLEPGVPVFPLPGPGKGAVMLRADLKAAGIPYRDVSGLVFDFHALRCEMATLADLAGVSPRVVQKLMRHSTLELTGRYTRPRAVDIKSAASMLPSLRPEGNHPDTIVMTGTDSRPVASPRESATSTEDDGCKPLIYKGDTSIELRSDRPKHRRAS
jgi:integrase